MFLGFSFRRVVLGLWPALAQYKPLLVDTISGAGSTQATATQLTGEVNRITTNAASAGVVLAKPTGPSDAVTVIVDSGVAASTTLYPATGGKLNGLAANTGVTVAAGKSVLCVAINATDWVVLLSP